MDYLPYLLLILATLPLLFQMRVLWRSRRLRGQPVPELESGVEAQLKQHDQALLYFYSPSCGPCRAMTPRIDQLAAQHGNVFKFDVAQSLDIARKFGVMATPTTVLVKDGKIAEAIPGPLSDKKLEALLG